MRTFGIENTENLIKGVGHHVMGSSHTPGIQLIDKMRRSNRLMQVLAIHRKCHISGRIQVGMGHYVVCGC